MATRDEMLERVRAALGRPKTGPQHLPPPRLDNIMPPISHADLISKFESELQGLAGSAHRAATAAEFDATLRPILETAKAQRVVLSANPILAELGLAAKLAAWGMTVCRWSAAPAGVAAAQQEFSFREAAFEADVGITGVEYVLAESGTLVLTSQTEGAQLASLAPPVHVALYRESQVVETLDDVLERLSGAGAQTLQTPQTTSQPTLEGTHEASFTPPQLPAAQAGRSIVFITGPSRTADIEQVLIRGVHGPRDVHAILIGDSCFGL